MSHTSTKATPIRDHPYDELLLKKSKVYNRSRSFYLDQGGIFTACLLSSARTLGSADLLKNEIQFSPVASELEWSLKDRFQKKETQHIEEVMRWITGVYHEQNHRILWNHFKQKKLHCPQNRAEAYRFLNLAESLVIGMDMALGDDLPPALAAKLYRQRSIYNAGADFMRKLKCKGRQYRNALHVCYYVTFLRLDGMHPLDMKRFVGSVFSNLDPDLVDLCRKRAMQIEPLFVEITNPIWQYKHVKAVMAAFAPPPGQAPLMLARSEPTESLKHYRIAEDWLSKFGI